MRDQLIDPLENLQERMCEKHEKILEFFCRDEQVCICLLCRETDHKYHKTVYDNIDSSEMSREKAEVDGSDKLFNTLMNHVQASHTKLKSNIDKKIQKSQESDKVMIEELQEEIAQLQRKNCELEELSQSDDHLHLLQTLQALSTISGTKDWSKLRVYPDLCVETLRTMTPLVHTFLSELKTLTDPELTRVSQYKECVTFDPATAGCSLVVSERGKLLTHYKPASPLSSDNDPKRFNCPMVLGMKGFTSGRHYWEVQLGLKANWAIGGAKETVTRTRVTLTKENGFFVIGQRCSENQMYCTPDPSPVSLAKKCRRVCGLYGGQSLFL
ncbi:E3 ubiquitin-protein ligase TRIM38-like isoform X1 [Sander vitreus]